MLLDDYNSLQGFGTRALVIREKPGENRCSGNDQNLADAANNNRWAMGNDGVGNAIKLRHEGTRFTNF